MPSRLQPCDAAIACRSSEDSDNVTSRTRSPAFTPANRNCKHSVVFPAPVSPSIAYRPASAKPPRSTSSRPWIPVESRRGAGGLVINECILPEEPPNVGGSPSLVQGFKRLNRWRAGSTSGEQQRDTGNECHAAHPWRHKTAPLRRHCGNAEIDFIFVF